MLKKITFSLFLMAFSLSTFLSIPGIIPLIAEYFSVSISMAGLFVGLFALILSVTGLFLPSYFSKYERKNNRNKFLFQGLRYDGLENRLRCRSSWNNRQND